MKNGKNNIYKNVAGRGLVTGMNYHRHPRLSAKKSNRKMLTFKELKKDENLSKE